MASQARKSKVKWTERMNNDILECKRKAKELVSSEKSPCNENGRKRGYVDIMKENVLPKISLKTKIKACKISKEKMVIRR